MLVLCFGIPKSGSTLAFELVRGVLMGAGYPQDPLRVENVAPTGRGVNFMKALQRGRASKEEESDERRVTITRESMTRVISEIGDNRIIAVKTHEAFPPPMFEWLENLQAERKLQVFASYRDPRDICLSLLDQAQDARDRGRFTFSRIADLEHAVGNVKRRLSSFQRWAALTGSVKLYYETVAFSPDDAITAIEKALGLTADHEAVKKYAFEEAFTQKNKAVSHRHLELDPEEQKKLRREFGKFIRRAFDGDFDKWLADYRLRLLERTAHPAE